MREITTAHDLLEEIRAKTEQQVEENMAASGTLLTSEEMAFFGS